MNHKRLYFFLGLIAGVLLAIAVTFASQPFTGAKVETLLLKELAREFTPDREVLVDLVEIPPHTTLERHWHPGEEFHYCIEGEAELVIDGAEPVLEMPGKAAHVPYKALHTAVTKEKAAKLLVFRVHKKGEPMRYLESDTTKVR